MIADNIVDAAVVGGITAFSQLSTGNSDYRAAMLAFALTFLIKLKDLRHIS